MSLALAPRPTLTPKQKLVIMARYCRCPGLPDRGHVCGAHLPAMSDCEFDHIHPRSLGGSDEIDNLRPLCPDCHALKTFGRRPGASKTATTAGSDAGIRAKVRKQQARRLELEASTPCAEEEIDRRARVDEGGDDMKRVPASRWPKGRKLSGRGFPKRGRKAC